MPTSFQYPLSAFQNGIVNLDRLFGEIDNAVSVAQNADPTLIDDVVTVSFGSNVADPSPDKTALDHTINVHNGRPFSGAFAFRASSTLLSSPTEFTTTSTTFVDVAGITTNVAQIIRNMRQALGRVVGQASAQGGGNIEIQVVKEDGTALNTEPFVVNNTNGAFTKFAFSTNQPPVKGAQTYRLQARVTTALTTGKLRYTSLTLAERL